MPRGDRTGPLGRGPMTGRGLGYCAGYDAPGFMFGRGFGRGRRFPAPALVKLSKEEQIKVLEAQKKALEKRLEELKGDAKA